MGVPQLDPGVGRIGGFPVYSHPNYKVDHTTAEIVKVDEIGIITADGQHRPVDMLVCATGFHTSYTPRFVIKSRGGQPLTIMEGNSGDVSLDWGLWLPELVHFPWT